MAMCARFLQFIAYEDVLRSFILAVFQQFMAYEDTRSSLLSSTTIQALPSKSGKKCFDNPPFLWQFLASINYHLGQSLLKGFQLMLSVTNLSCVCLH